jgi:hypothetical protein
MIIEGTVVTKEEGLSATFEGVEQPYVRCTVARLDVPLGATVKLEVTRIITDRRAGVVRFDCKLLN